jgi:DnaK suppressor protein
MQTNETGQSAQTSGQNEIRRRLIEERAEVKRALDESSNSAIEVPQVSDLASVDQQRAVEYGRQDALSERLRQLDDALGRMTEGGYGECAKCGSAIDPKRLVNDPAVSLCMDCQTLVEGNAPSPSL